MPCWSRPDWWCSSAELRERACPRLPSGTRTLGALTVDPMRLRQILLNLLSNAFPVFIKLQMASPVLVCPHLQYHLKSSSIACCSSSVSLLSVDTLFFFAAMMTNLILVVGVLPRPTQQRRAGLFYITFRHSTAPNLASARAVSRTSHRADMPSRRHCRLRARAPSQPRGSGKPSSLRPSL